MAFLIGLLIGSLWILWPFKDLESGAAVVDRSGEVKEEVKIATAKNRLPKNSKEGMAAGGALVVGAFCSSAMIMVGRRRRKSD
jgi:putative membrane protein